MARAKHIPEWEEYDAEIARFARHLAEKGIIRSEMVAADATVLADVGINKPAVDEAGDAGTSSREEGPVHLLDEL